MGSVCRCGRERYVRRRCPSFPRGTYIDIMCPQWPPDGFAAFIGINCQIQM